MTGTALAIPATNTWELTSKTKRALAERDGERMLGDFFTAMEFAVFSVVEEEAVAGALVDQRIAITELKIFAAMMYFVTCADFEMTAQSSDI